MSQPAVTDERSAVIQHADTINDAGYTQLSAATATLQGLMADLVNARFDYLKGHEYRRYQWGKVLHRETPLEFPEWLANLATPAQRTLMEPSTVTSMLTPLLTSRCTNSDTNFHLDAVLQLVRGNPRYTRTSQFTLIRVDRCIMIGIA